MSGAVGVVAVAGMTVVLLALAGWLRVWEPNHVLLVREVGARLERERRRREGPVTRARRLPRILAWAAELRDLQGQLVIAGRDPDPVRWLARQAARMAVAAGGLLLVNVISLEVGDGLALDWGVAGILAVVVTPLVGYQELRAGVRRTRLELGRAFRDMLELLAVRAAGSMVADPMRDPSEIRAGDWVARFAGWRRDPTLRTLLEGNRWRQLTRRRPRSGAEWFEVIAEAYGVPEAQAVARILRIQRERGPEVADEYLREARRLSRQVLAERQLRARRDRLAHTAASVGLLLSIFVLLILAVSSVRL